MNAEVLQFLLNLPEDKRVLASTLRDILLNVDPQLTESIKWGNLTISYKTDHLVFIYTYKTTNYINLGFLKATSLEDQDHILQGTGKGMRHVKIKSVIDIQPTLFKKWMLDSINLPAIYGSNHL